MKYYKLLATELTNNYLVFTLNYFVLSILCHKN